MRLLHAITLSTAVCCAGCVPFDRTEIPEIHGKVVDRHTTEPIANASVTITGGWNGNVIVHAITDASGRFEVARVGEAVWVPPLRWSDEAPDARFDVSAAGFNPWSINLYSVRPVDLGPDPIRRFEVHLSLTRVDADP